MPLMNTSISTTVDNTFQLIGIVIIFIIILAAAYFISKWVGSSGIGQFKNKNLRIIETIRLTPNKYVQIIKTGGKYIVIGISKDHIEYLTELSSDEVEILEDGNQTVDFKDVLQKITIRNKKNKIQ